MFFFFKQKTAYEMRISDWSSDVCSSDLQIREAGYVCSNHLGIGVGTASIKRTGARQPGSQESRIDFQFYKLGRNLLTALNFTLIAHYDPARDIRPLANFGLYLPTVVEPSPNNPALGLVPCSQTEGWPTAQTGGGHCTHHQRVL